MGMNSSKSKFRIKKSNSKTDLEDNWLRKTGKLDRLDFGTETNKNLEVTGTVDQFNITFRNLEVTNDSRQIQDLGGSNFAKKNHNRQEENYNANFTGTTTGNTLDLSKPSLQVNKKNKIVVYNLDYHHLEKPPSTDGDRPPQDFSNKNSQKSSSSKPRLPSASSKKKLVYMGCTLTNPTPQTNNMNHIPSTPQSQYSNLTGKTNLTNLNAKLKSKPNLPNSKQYLPVKSENKDPLRAKGNSSLNKGTGRAIVGKYGGNGGLSPIDRDLVGGRLKLGSRGALGGGLGRDGKRRQAGGQGDGGKGGQGGEDGREGNFSKDYTQFIAKLKEEKKKFKDFTNN
jgi:hypothetical protein